MEEPTLKSSDAPNSFKTSLTLPEYFLKEADHWNVLGKTVWAIDSQSGISQEYGLFEEKTRRVASSLVKRGMQLGDTLIYMSKDLINLHVLYTGVWRANAIVRANYPEDTIDTIYGIVLESDAKWMVCDAENLSKCYEVKKRVTEKNKQLEIIVVGMEKKNDSEDLTSLADILADPGDICPKLQLQPENIALILPTSGTTGKTSKGVALSHQALISMIAKYNTEILWTDSLNFMMVKSMHISGSTYPFSTFCMGKPCLFLSQISMENIITAFKKYRPGCLFGFINFITALANNSATMDTTCVENIVTGGVATGPSVPDTLKQFKNFKNLIILYGLTEANVLTFHHVNFKERSLNDMKPLSVGKVGPYTWLQIRDPETGKVLGPNQRGEICAKTSSMFTSYIGRPKEMEEAFVDGWLRSGDLGYYDEEEFVFVDGRLKEMFKSFGYHISPSELDEVISRHPAVATVCTIGVPDPEGGEKKPRAYVTLKDGSIASPQEIINFAHGILASYKHLRGGLFIVPDLPRGSSGKITRALVEKKFLRENEI